MLYTDGDSACQGYLCLNGRTITALTWDKFSSSIPQLELVAKDSAGQKAEAILEASVAVKYVKPTHTFTLTLSDDYSMFSSDHQKQVDLYRKLSNSFPAGSVVTFESVTEGSTVVRFTLSNDVMESTDEEECPTGELESFSSAAFTDGKVQHSLKTNLRPFTVSKLEFVPVEVCEGKVEPVIAEVKPPVDATSGEEKDGSLLIIIIVVVVLVVLIVIIIIVVIVVKRRQSRRAQYQAAGHIEKGVPRVLDEEKKAIEKPEQQTLLSGEERQDTENKTTPKPPAYPETAAEARKDGYQPPTPPVSEPDEHDRSL